LLVGASFDDSASAYLFSTSGALVTVITNPTPAAGGLFGSSVAALGADRVLIGAHEASTGANFTGAAYLFSTKGALLTTFTNPTPAFAEFFGYSLAAVGSDRLLIGANQGFLGALRAGAAYLFSTNGSLFTTFTNPTPADADYFGSSVAVVGSDLILIGAYQDDTGATNAGAAYLFNTNGRLLITFTNPAPAANDYFGSSVAVVGNDRVLIGASRDDTGATDAGAVYLFNTNGTLLTTFTNPAPAASDYFGSSVAAVRNDRILIGASRDDTGATDAGTVYLFSTNGTQLTTFTNPAPAASDYFGSALASMANERLLVGAYGENTGASGAGAAYLFTPSSPSLVVSLTATNKVAVSWPSSSSSNWMLQQNTGGISSANWTIASGPIQDDGTKKTFIVNPPGVNCYYRLVLP
jgi:hypothetical protein